MKVVQTLEDTNILLKRVTKVQSEMKQKDEKENL